MRQLTRRGWKCCNRSARSRIAWSSSADCGTLRSVICRGRNIKREPALAVRGRVDGNQASFLLEDPEHQRSCIVLADLDRVRRHGGDADLPVATTRPATVEH